MKKTIFILLLSCVTAVGMAQHHCQPGCPGHHDHGSAPHHEMHQAAPSSPEQLMMVLQVLDNQSFDDKKLEIAKLSVCLGHFFVQDMVQMASRFSFDDKRKEFFIFAYPYCLDRENYYLLKDAFTFRSNFDEVMEAVLPGYSR